MLFLLPPPCLSLPRILGTMNRPTKGQLLAKIPKVPCLYRNKYNGTYYGIKKIIGKEKDHLQRTIRWT